MELRTARSRNLFEVDNARDLSREEIASTFVKTRSFWSLVEPKNHIILGSRGSGKTVLARMLAHDHLSLFEDPDAKKAIADQTFIGTYVPLRLEWVSALKNKPWQNDAETEAFFQWRLNLACMLAFLTTARSCLKAYCPDEVTRFAKEKDFCGRLASLLFQLRSQREPAFLTKIVNLEDLEVRITEIGIAHEQTLTHARVSRKAVEKIEGGELAAEFHSELFSPLRVAMEVLTAVLKINPGAYWLLCLDEAEFLDTIHLKIINSYLRSYSGKIYFKLTTMPYMHRTLETNAAAPLEEGHDFDYVYIDHDRAVDPDGPVTKGINQPEIFAEVYQFAEQIFQRRAAKSNFSQLTSATLKDLLGASSLIDAQPFPETDLNLVLEKIRAHCDFATIERATEMVSEIQSAKSDKDIRAATTRLKDSVLRKLRGAIALREAIEKSKGHSKLSIYSGANLVVRCSDGNPRRLVRLFNSMITRGDWQGRKVDVDSPLVSQSRQTEILKQFAESLLAHVQSELRIGNQLHEFILRLGRGFSWQLHENRLSSDIYGSVAVSSREFEKFRPLIERAVGIGLLFPKYTEATRNRPPPTEGVFRLAFALAPKFSLMPRADKSRSLGKVWRDAMASQVQTFTSRTRADDQTQILDLFLSMAPGKRSE